MAAVVNSQTMLAMLNALRSGSLSGSKIHLFLEGGEPTINDDVDTYSEPEGDWYTAVTATYGTVYSESSGSISVTARSQQFNYGSSTDPAENVGGYFITTSDNATVLFAEKFPTAVSMSNSLSACIVDATLTLDQQTG